MKTLYLNRTSNILIDDEIKTARKLVTQRTAVSSIYLAEEPMTVVYGDGTYERTINVDKGDIIISFYESDYPYRIIAVKNEEWLNNLVEYNKKQQEQKEKWAANNPERKDEDI